MLRQLCVALVLVACLLETQGADKYTDENRPYEFGFNIEGEQHRKEKKDEDGIIMGEFGFITADGVYHVTVYATDENGNFKILSMKNIRVKPYPTAGAERQGHSLAIPPSQPKPGPVQQQNLPASVQGQQPAPAVPQQQKPISVEPPARSCSHCSLPTTRAPPAASNFNNPQSPQGGFGGNPQYNQASQFGGPQNQQGFPGAGGASPGQLNSPGQFNPSGQFGGPQNQYNNPSQVGGPQSQFGSGPNDPQLQGQRNPKQFDPNTPQRASSSGRQQPQNNVPESIDSRFSQPQPKPQLISAQMQIVDKNTDVHQRNPGEKEGLPNGLTKNDMKLLLYTFNYTVGFHGHHEEGYTNGAKKGYYFVTGRNGVRTRVDYEADENGFRPKITQEVLDLVSDDVPKPETEKDEKYGLKGYEFKWIYYPVNAKSK